MIVGKMQDGIAVLSTRPDKVSQPQPDDVIFDGGQYYRIIGGHHVQRVLLNADQIQPIPTGDLLLSIVNVMLGKILPGTEPITLSPTNQASMPTIVDLGGS